MCRVYCDTCVYMDALGLNDNTDPFKDLPTFAWNFFNALKEGKYVLVTSSWVFEEFENVVGSDEKLKELIKDLELKKIIHIEEKYEDRKEAGQLSHDNFADARHVVLAKKGNAMILTTQNIQHMVNFSEYLEKHCIELMKPENL